MRSVEADIVLFDDPDGSKADVVDGSIGEASVFHDTYGFYAQGLSIETAVLPQGWEGRLVRFETPMTDGVVAWCLSLSDLWISKALAGRPKDLEFCRAIVSEGMVDPEQLVQLLEATDAHESKRALALGLLDRGSSGS